MAAGAARQVVPAAQTVRGAPEQHTMLCVATCVWGLSNHSLLPAELCHGRVAAMLHPYPPVSHKMAAEASLWGSWWWV
jgi:hypothetical protein